MVVDVGPIECHLAARYVVEVAQELAVVHGVAPFHGGVRPDNILIDEAGVAQLGGSKPSLVGEAPNSPVVEELLDVSGVVDCLAPEQALTACKADLRSDIYSLGCTFYYLLTGRPPFSDGTLSERLLKHQTTMPESIGKIRPVVPLELIRICEKMLAKRPNDRYQTAQEVIAAIANWRANLPDADSDR
jgi:serine/threonine-protein kinase